MTNDHYKKKYLKYKKKYLITKNFKGGMLKTIKGYINPLHLHNSKESTQVLTIPNLLISTINKDNSVLIECLELLNNSRLEDLLLNGIELSNTFSLNKEMTHFFIENQNTEEKKKAAEVLIKTHQYITYSYFIENFRKVVELFFRRINGKKYIIDTESKTKSGFFCTMIFLFIVKELIETSDNSSISKYYLPEDIIINFPKKQIITINDIYIMQINDMDYSANQLSWTIGEIKNETDKYIVLRTFTNSYALQQNHVKKLIIENNYIYGEQLPTFKEKLFELYNTNQIEYSTIDEIDKIHDNVISFFASCSSSEPGIMNVYLDHKIADWGSTVSLALTIGIIPNNSAYFGDENICIHTDKSTLYYTEELDKNETLTKPQQYIIPLINNCDYNIIKNKYTGDYNKMRNELDNSNELRCPYSWYKNINYDTGELDLTNNRNTSDYLNNPIKWEPFTDIIKIEEYYINNNNIDKFNKIKEIIYQLTFLQLKELYKFVFGCNIMFSKKVTINTFLKKIENNDDLLTKTLNWNKFEDYLHIKFNF